MDDLREKFSKIEIDSNKNIQNVVHLLNKLLADDQEPYIEVKNNLKVRKIWGIFGAHVLPGCRFTTFLISIPKFLGTRSHRKKYDF